MLPYQTILRPLLFSLPPENAHHLGEFVLKRKTLWKFLERYLKTDDHRLKTTLAGVELANPVGVAAGCDKNCEFLSSLMNLGFGYAIGGTVTLEARTGNASPRLIRDKNQRSLVNSLGFPGKGAKAIVKNLEMSEAKPIFLSIAGLTIEEFVELHCLVEPWAVGVELNISSPNTAGLRIFHEPEMFHQLLEQINSVRHKPLLVKIPPYVSEQGKEVVLALVRIAQEMGVDGITATNTQPIQEPRLKVKIGGLSGKPLFQNMLRIVADVRTEVGGMMTINACGGISGPQEAIQALKHGANTVQLYTGLIYEGPGVAKNINRGLSSYISEHSLKSTRNIRAFTDKAPSENLLL